VIVMPELRTQTLADADDSPRESRSEGSSTVDPIETLPDRSLWYLTSRPNQDGSLQEIAVSSDPFRVGRHSDNQLRLSNSTISGRHAELFFVADDLFIRDLRSTNGTLINGRRIRTATGLREGDTIHFGTVLYTVQRHGRDSNKATVTADILQEAVGHLNFDKLLADPGLRPFYQPIVRMEDGETVAWEVLARSRLAGLENPASMFRIAAERGSEAMLSSLSRYLGLYTAREFDIDAPLYLNTHPVELNRPELVDSLHALREKFPDAPVTVEIHEGSITSTEFLRDFRDLLNELSISLAYDDFGSGQARLLELIDVPPDVLKFDMKFVRGIEGATAERRRMIQSLVEVVRSLNVIPLAEGIETKQEADVCRELGFELAQGFLFGHPRPACECG
jgi:EAL domain-containing protein (putative c-di-GMP-specific phosphodiesterase class I)